MKKINIYIKNIQIFLLSGITYLIGGIDSLFITLLIMIFIDYITGVCKAIYLKKLSSKIGIKGIIKKVGYVIIVAVATLVDYLTNNSNFAMRTLVIYFLISNEGMSILENWGELGLPLPKKLFDIFESIKKEE